MGALQKAFNDTADKNPKKIHLTGLRETATANMYRAPRGLIMYTAATRLPNAETGRGDAQRARTRSARTSTSTCRWHPRRTKPSWPSAWFAAAPRRKKSDFEKKEWFS
jgi:hypothetical protein